MDGHDADNAVAVDAKRQETCGTQYFDARCPFCRAWHTTTQQILVCQCGRWLRLQAEPDKGD